MTPRLVALAVALGVLAALGAVEGRRLFHAPTAEELVNERVAAHRARQAPPTAPDDSTATVRACVVRENGRLVARLGVADDHVASATFQNSLNHTGWGILDVKTSAAAPDTEQAFVAGQVEGFVTAHHIYTTQANLFPNIFGNDTTTPPKAVVDFLDAQEAWAAAQVKANAKDPFWRQVGLVLAQYQGLEAGYKQQSDNGTVPPLDHFAFQMLNAVGDLFDIIPAVDPSKRVDWLSLGRREAESLHARHGHCSGLVKVTGNFSELFMGHSSWYLFANTNRIFKHYHFAFNDAATAAHRVSFSSYPGFLESLDDFYLMNSGLGMVQTSNGVLNHTAYANVKPQSLLAWQRVRTASAMATSGPEWFKVFSKFHSGTYANQYMVVDFNLFTPNTVLQDNTLWVVEEMPGIIVGADQTETLKRGYWPSYNIPFYKEVFEASGYPAMAKKFGNYFTYELCPRAQIFRRDQGTVQDLDTFKQILRSNNYKTDPYSFDGETQNPDYAICSRGDLATVSPRPGGCYDTKVTSYTYGAKDLLAQAINGPTTNGGSLPPFAWAPFADEAHFGLPDSYAFDFVKVFPEG